MTIDDKTKNEKLQYDINREAARISALSSGKIDKYEYVTGEGILPSHQSRIIEQAKFTYFPVVKAFEKQRKTIEDQGIKQGEALKALKPEIRYQIQIKEFFQKTSEIQDETYGITKWEDKIKRGDPKYKTKNHTYNFQQYVTIRSFDESIYTGKINIDEAEMDQSNLLKNLVEFNNISRARTVEGKDKKDILMKVHRPFIKVEN